LIPLDARRCVVRNYLDCDFVKSADSVRPGGLAAVIAREREVALRARRGDLYLGTSRSLSAGAKLVAEPTVEVEVHAALDAERPAGMQARAAAVAVAASIRDATVIAAIRLDCEPSGNGSSQVRVYRVQAESFHAGALAIIEELRQRIRDGRPFEALVREYWTPTGDWHLQEVLVPVLTVIEEVPPASERERYVPRWILYREDGERAQRL
jgi:hypothetical protein